MGTAARRGHFLLYNVTGVDDIAAGAEWPSGGVGVLCEGSGEAVMVGVEEERGDDKREMGKRKASDRRGMGRRKSRL